MDRAEFLKLFSIATIGGTLGVSCNDKDGMLPSPTPSFKGKVIVIGAGVSGMAAAQTLINNGITDIQVFEASNKLWGRIATLKQFADADIELGADFSMGYNNPFTDILFNKNLPNIPTKGQEYLFYDNQLKSSKDWKGFPEVDQVKSVVEGIFAYNGPELTGEELYTQSRINSNLKFYFNSLLANSRATTLPSIGVLGVQEQLALWPTSKEKRVLKNGNYISALEENYVEVLDKIQLETPIKVIDYASDHVELIDDKGNLIQCDRVIVAVPISMFQNNIIILSPEMPSEKQLALSYMGTDQGIRVIISFNNRFWPEDMSSLFASGIIPEFYSIKGVGKDTNQHILVGTVYGSNAGLLSSLGSNAAMALVLQQLDTVFGLGRATLSYLKGYMHDWTAEPYIRGAYSYTKPGGVGAHQAWATTIQKKVYFAGEAAHVKGQFGTVQGAISAGIEAANKVLRS